MKKRGQIKRAIETLEAVGVSVVMPMRDQAITGKNEILDKIFPKSRKQKLIEKRDDLNEQINKIS